MKRFILFGYFWVFTFLASHATWLQAAASESTATCEPRAQIELLVPIANQYLAKMKESGIYFVDVTMEEEDAIEDFKVLLEKTGRENPMQAVELITILAQFDGTLTHILASENVKKLMTLAEGQKTSWVELPLYLAPGIPTRYEVSSNMPSWSTQFVSRSKEFCGQTPRLKAEGSISQIKAYVAEIQCKVNRRINKDRVLSKAGTFDSDRAELLITETEGDAGAYAARVEALQQAHASSLTQGEKYRIIDDLFIFYRQEGVVLEEAAEFWCLLDNIERYLEKRAQQEGEITTETEEDEVPLANYLLSTTNCPDGKIGAVRRAHAHLCKSERWKGFNPAQWNMELQRVASIWLEKELNILFAEMLRNFGGDEASTRLALQHFWGGTLGFPRPARVGFPTMAQTSWHTQTLEDGSVRRGMLEAFTATFVGAENGQRLFKKLHVASSTPLEQYWFAGEGSVSSANKLSDFLDQSSSKALFRLVLVYLGILTPNDPGPVESWPEYRTVGSERTSYMSGNHSTAFH